MHTRTNDKSNIGLYFNVILLCNFITECIGIAKFRAQSVGAQSIGANCWVQSVGRKIWERKE